MRLRMRHMLLICLVSCVVLGSSEQTEKKSGVIEEEPLSHHEDQHDHVLDHGHDHEDDHEHEALPEPDGARSFNQLAPEERITQPEILVDRIDINKDDFISEDELKIRIQNVKKNYTNGQVEVRRKDFDTDEDGLISWDKYKNVSYDSYMGVPVTKGDVNIPYMVQENQGFTAADTDEHKFNTFPHPEIFNLMRDVGVQETKDDFDKNGDGSIDVNEFMVTKGDFNIPMVLQADQGFTDADTGDFDKNGDGFIYVNEFKVTKGDVIIPYMLQEDRGFTAAGTGADLKVDTTHSDWMEKQRQDFFEEKDTNKDGKLDKQELRELMFPANHDVAGSVAKHLLKESDTNQDGKLTKSEILDKHEMFVESQVTNYGEAVVPHDEL